METWLFFVKVLFENLNDVEYEVGHLLDWYKHSRVPSFAGIVFRGHQEPKQNGHMQV